MERGHIDRLTLRLHRGKQGEDYGIARRVEKIAADSRLLCLLEGLTAVNQTA